MKQNSTCYSPVFLIVISDMPNAITPSLFRLHPDKILKVFFLELKSEKRSFAMINLMFQVHVALYYNNVPVYCTQSLKYSSNEMENWRINCIMGICKRIQQNEFCFNEKTFLHELNNVTGTYKIKISQQNFLNFPIMQTSAQTLKIIVKFIYDGNWGEIHLINFIFLLVFT